MNIVLVTSSSTSSGGARQALYMAAGFAEKGHQVKFYTPPGSDLRNKNSSINWLDLPESLWQIKKTLEINFSDEQPTVVHAFHNKAVKKIASIGSLWKMQGKPVVCAAHRGVIYKPGNPLPYILPGINRFIVNSQACADTLPLLWRKKRVEVVYNAIPSGRITPKICPQKMFNDLNIPQGKKIIGTIANNTPVKGMTYLLQAFAKINLKSHFLVIVGVNSEVWGKECAELGIIESVRLIPHTNNVADYLNIFNLFVLPSLMESQPNVLLEAMCMGLPAVATSVGGVPEILPHQELLCCPKDSEDLAAKIRLALENPALMQQAAAANLEQSKIFSVDYRLRRIEQIYQEMLLELKQT